jgi:hypothetical protein
MVEGQVEQEVPDGRVMPRPKRVAPLETTKPKTRKLAKSKGVKVTKGTRSKNKTKPTAIAEEPKSLPNPLLGFLNEYVRYYSEGWRCGTLVEVTKHHARIRPIVGKYAGEPNCIKVAFSDIQALGII